MKWNERLINPNVNIGDRFKNRNGRAYIITNIEIFNGEKHYHADRVEPKDEGVIVNGLKSIILNKNLGFGNYPNPFDLIKRL